MQTSFRLCSGNCWHTCCCCCYCCRRQLRDCSETVSSFLSTDASSVSQPLRTPPSQAHRVCTSPKCVLDPLMGLNLTSACPPACVLPTCRIAGRTSKPAKSAPLSRYSTLHAHAHVRIVQLGALCNWVVRGSLPQLEAFPDGVPQVGCYAFDKRRYDTLHFTPSSVSCAVPGPVLGLGAVCPAACLNALLGVPLLLVIRAYKRCLYCIYIRSYRAMPCPFAS